MGIQMVGINYSRAGIDIREKFSFTKTEKIRALQEFKGGEGILGCVLLATCNRTEVWVSAAEGFSPDIFTMLCQCKGLSGAKYRKYADSSRGKEAVEYLFCLAGGLKSQILGEDQILTQVGEALSFSREYFCTDTVLEVLFRMAVTAGKEIKTKINIPSGNDSAPHAAICQLEREGYSFQGSRCLVIGNGTMGRLSAQLLMERGADVTVTVRQYRSGVVDIPQDAKRIEYGRRYEMIPQCSFVFSATASPNITIQGDVLKNLPLLPGTVFVDLAVPRDMDAEVAMLENVRLLNMDYFQIDAVSPEVRELLAQADSLLAHRVEEYITWYESRDVVPMLLSLSEAAAQDVLARAGRHIRRVCPEEPKVLEQPIGDAVKKVVSKLLFSIRDSVDAATFRECTKAMQGLYGCFPDDVPADAADGHADRPIGVRVPKSGQ